MLKSAIKLCLLVFCGLSVVACGSSTTEQVTRTVEQPSESTSQATEQARKETAEREAEQARKEAAEQEEKAAQAKNTQTYWATWKTISSQVIAPFKKYTETVSVNNSQQLSELYAAFAEAVSNLSVDQVDSELVNLAANATVLYRRRVMLYQQQADILSRYQQFLKETNSSEKFGEVLGEMIVREILVGDSRAVPGEVLMQWKAREKELKQEWQQNSTALTQVDNDIAELAAKRDALRLNLASQYGLEFEKWD